MQLVNPLPLQISLALVTVCLLYSDDWISLNRVFHFLCAEDKIHWLWVKGPLLKLIL